MRYTTEKGKPLAKTRRVRSFHGDPNFGCAAASVVVASTDSRNLVAEALLMLLGVRNLFEELVLRFLEEANRCHCVRRRAAAKTSSAGMSLASPRSYFVMRLVISASHAA